MDDNLRKTLISFGNYLLSEISEKKGSNSKAVTDADLSNWESMQEQENEITQKAPGDFTVVEIGTTYHLPKFKVEKGVGLVEDGFHEISFVRGSRLAEEEVTPVTGITHESLLEMQLEDLRFKQILVPSRETACAITAMEESRMWLQRRQDNRKKAGTQGTYKK